ncbi:hypothetical protein HKX48_007470 [Thoreauomyces humboldtii]|nr:hypothetical protein HKX48_007470 [Thoreauomyces humboldtii]
MEQLLYSFRISRANVRKRTVANIYLKLHASANTIRVITRTFAAEDRTTFLTHFVKALDQNRAYRCFGVAEREADGVHEISLPYYEECPEFYDWSVVASNGKTSNLIGFYNVGPFKSWQPSVPRTVNELCKESDYSKWRSYILPRIKKHMDRFAGDDVDRTVVIGTFAVEGCSKSERNAAFLHAATSDMMAKARAAGMTKWLISAAHPTTVVYATKVLNGELIGTVDPRGVQVDEGEVLAPEIVELLRVRTEAYPLEMDIWSVYGRLLVIVNLYLSCK